MRYAVRDNELQNENEMIHEFRIKYTVGKYQVAYIHIKFTVSLTRKTMKFKVLVYVRFILYMGPVLFMVLTPQGVLQGLGSQVVLGTLWLLRGILCGGRELARVGLERSGPG